MTASSSIRRSPVQDCLEELDPEWMEIHKMKAALRFKGGEPGNRSKVCLCDLSCMPKMGLKGPQALAWLVQRGIEVPESVYGWHSLEGDGLVVRADRHEVFLEDGPNSDRIARFESELRSYSRGLYLVPRQDASFLLDGVKSNAVMRETCGVDLNQPRNEVVMTRVAGVSCMILPIHAGKTQQAPAFRLWLDSSYGCYLWKALLEIVHDHGGKVIGLEDLYLSFLPGNSIKGELK